MNTQEALEKIEEINTIVQSGNRIIFSGKMWIALGLYTLLVPVIGYFTQWLTFGHDFGASQVAYIAIADGFLFWGLGMLIIMFFKRRKDPGVAGDPVHPLIRKAFSIVRPVCASFAGIIIIFSITGQGKFIYPMIFIIGGLMYSVFGKFSAPEMVYMAWSYIFAGLLFFYLRSYDIPLLDLYFVAYNGLSFVALGIFLLKREKANA